MHGKNTRGTSGKQDEEAEREKGELDKGVQRSYSFRWRPTESGIEPPALGQAPFKWMESAPF